MKRSGLCMANQHALCFEAEGCDCWCHQDGGSGVREPRRPKGSPSLSGHEPVPVAV